MERGEGDSQHASFGSRSGAKAHKVKCWDLNHWVWGHEKLDELHYKLWNICVLFNFKFSCISSVWEVCVHHFNPWWRSIYHGGGLLLFIGVEVSFYLALLRKIGCVQWDYRGSFLSHHKPAAVLGPFGMAVFRQMKLTPSPIFHLDHYTK